MRTRLLIFAANVSLVLGGCTAKKQEHPNVATGAAYAPTGTIKDLMDSIVDPNASFLWGSVETTVSAKGVDRKAPRTDEDWKEVRRHAITLIEATNLLLMPNRLVAEPGEKPSFPDVEETPEEIESLIDANRAGWESRILGLRDAAMMTLAAINSKDVAGLEDSGERLDVACEACHLVYWYPKDKTSQQIHGQSVRQTDESHEK